ncbi:MAG: zinc ribbon domain-containing protein [Anaerolineae bacterium]|nr:zinc ribbon domain-containing protein [Anaerolineae bacterium]
MPTYEYRCLDCRKRFSQFFTYAEYGVKAPVCSHCGSLNVQRRITRVRIARTEESRLENLADPSNLAALDEDPRSLGRMMREMSKETGEDMGAEFDEVVNRLESGQDPESIERDMPELSESLGGGGGDFED